MFCVSEIEGMGRLKEKQTVKVYGALDVLGSTSDTQNIDESINIPNPFDLSTPYVF